MFRLLLRALAEDLISKYLAALSTAAFDAPLNPEVQTDVADR